MIALAMALLLVAQDAPPPVENIEVLRGVMETTLNDYPSARFRLVRISEDGQHVCGEVNWRGPAGGYGGWTAFMVDANETGFLARTAPNLEAVTNYRRTCEARTDWRNGDYSTALTFPTDR